MAFIQNLKDRHRRARKARLRRSIARIEQRELTPNQATARVRLIYKLTMLERSN